MLRTGQSLLANALVHLHLGRGAFPSLGSAARVEFDGGARRVGRRRAAIMSFFSEENVWLTSEIQRRLATPGGPTSQRGVCEIRRDLDVVPRRAESVGAVLVRPSLLLSIITPPAMWRVDADVWCV